MALTYTYSTFCSRQGKMIEVKMEGNGENEVREKIDLLCDRLFANTVIEDYEYSLEKL